MQKVQIVEGTVVKGACLGRTLGFPTANINASDNEAKNGVCLVGVEGVGKKLRGVTNLGRRPTVGVGIQRLLEVHILDFDGDLYGLNLKVTLTTKLRNEVHFESVETMAEQVHRDIVLARSMLTN